MLSLNYNSNGEGVVMAVDICWLAGIRGFGAGGDQKAVIEFGKPLTLITGQNGAGKTVR